MNNSTYSLLGLNGKMMHCGQSLTISGGKITEDIVFKSIMDSNKFKDIKILSNKPNNKKGVKLNFYDILEKMNLNEKYVGRKVSITDERETIDVDLLLYINNVFHIIEIKSSANFDTKKIVGEVNSLFKSSIFFQKKMIRNQRTKHILVKPYFCAIDAANEFEVIKGSKGNILENKDFVKNDAIQDIIAYSKRVNIDTTKGFYEFIKSALDKQDSFISNEHPNIINNSHIKKLYIQPLSGKQLFEDILNIDFSELKNKRKEGIIDMYPIILKKKVRDCVITKDESELFFLIFNLMKLVDENSIDLSVLKKELERTMAKSMIITE